MLEMLVVLLFLLLVGMFVWRLRWHHHYVCLLILFIFFILFGFFLGGFFQVSFAFFHPNCTDGGGGERVLWMAIHAVQQVNFFFIFLQFSHF
jgi:hypothetical protein